ncbi:RNA polymerase sigma-70 factor (ECF subfamily) [Actinocorallia herbida]|uniref:RNA polymerase sigma-70 factor (ECF subfamily) n=1 Tax=Actinocorallia herbida TaxID=58109 RepID=A0A3N1CVQ9_9ACTN|nr:hypothetical protein [Actinocorallia herbida]ROO85379.1 RNA polymerase sigma-70 factor (ECF subfamily) [Actinocorallia herbida]
MTGASAVSLAEMLDERRHLLEIATWLFDPAAADEIVHATYRRWYALADRDRAGIAVPRAWLTRTAGGICLELLASTAAVTVPEGLLPDVPGDVEHRPEPRGGPDPVSEWLRRNPPRDDANPDLLAGHDAVVRRFAGACATGDAAALRAVLAADAMVVSDGGGKVRAASEPTLGAAAVARFVTDLLGGEPRPAVALGSVNGRAGVLLRAEEQVVAVVSASVAGDDVTAVWIMLNPDKLRRWQLGLAGDASHRTPAGPGRGTGT